MKCLFDTKKTSEFSIMSYLNNLKCKFHEYRFDYHMNVKYL